MLEEAKEALVKELVNSFKNIVAIYEFKREVSKFNSLIRNTKGLVIILSSSMSMKKLKLIDIIYDKIQDTFGWPLGVKIANSFSRGYVRTKQNLWEINVYDPRCLLPEDMVNLSRTKKLLYGEAILKEYPLPYSEEYLLNLNFGLSRAKAKEITTKYPEYLPLIDPSVCWARHEFVIKHKVAKKLFYNLKKLKKGKKQRTHAHIYGRYGGSGKTQIVYSLIKECKKLRLPFIYRTGFWKDKEGKYINGDIEANKAENVSKWLADKMRFNNTVIFIDEVDINLEMLNSYLSEKSKTKLNYYIVSVAKELPEYVAHKFEIYDISTKFQFTKKNYKQILAKLFELSNITKEIFPDKSREIIIKKTKLWNHINFRRTPMSVILASSLSLIESIKIAEQQKTNFIVKPETALKWSILATSPLFQQYDEIHDVHAEYLIYDGHTYVEVDPFYSHPLP